jgi:hypothetical protein
VKVEVGYARPDIQVLIVVEVADGATVETAIRASGLLAQFPEIDLSRNSVGIFSRICRLDQPLLAGDRVEIYRPLLTDPKEARRARAGGR